jgi:VIT1/CCC1 family predicted Fe2+/Mn2+ transporter
LGRLIQRILGRRLFGGLARAVGAWGPGDDGFRAQQELLATGSTRITFLVGLAAAVGAGISMGFSEGLSDDGSLTGRGNPFLRGAITGLATFVGGILHTLPFLIPHVQLALYVAFGVVGFELLAISFIRYRYFDMSFFMSALQVILGGALVFVSGILIGSA